MSGWVFPFLTNLRTPEGVLATLCILKMKKSILFAAVLFLAGASGASAAVLTQVPVQNYGEDTMMWMLMPEVSYHSASDSISMLMPTAVPQLTPLLVSNPGDSFDPADPWFGALNPGAGGASFSRRYGFTMSQTTDTVPTTRQIWIRKLSGPAELKFYRYRDTAPKMFEPVFGTDGTTNIFLWNRMMFHPVVSAPPGTNDLTATFEVYLVDTATGLEMPGSSSGPLVFDWTNVSDGRPALSLAQKIVVAWPDTTATNWVLESAATINASTWEQVTNAPVTVEGQPSVILDQNAAQQFFRMRFVP
jgi:hypothetical protein